MSIVEPAAILQPETGCETPYRQLVPIGGVAAYPAVAPPISATRAIVGLRFSFLPDFLDDHTLLGESLADRLAEVLQRQVLLVQNLWKWQSAAFSLRYFFDPAKGDVDVALLARIVTHNNTAAQASRQLGIDLHRLVHAHGFAAEQVQSLDDLAHLCAPYASPFVAELRQYESAAYLFWKGNYQYVVHGYEGPTGTWLQLFAALLRLSSPCLINLHLEPTRLSEQEEIELAREAALAATMTEEQRRMYSENSTGRFSDPQAGLVAQRYRSLLDRLVQPFAVVAQVAGKDEFAVNSIAHMLGAACTFSPTAGETHAAYQVGYPQTLEEQRCAERTLHHLVLTPWRISPNLQGTALQRLSYLSDAKGATSLFRFPVAVRGGIPGIAVRQIAPDFDPGSRQEAVTDEIRLGKMMRGGAVVLKVNELSRHGLVAGLPGSGKTNTCLSILDQLHQRQIPFLVIEPAKTEYRGLLAQSGYDKLLVFTAGDETTSPFRLNPFELLPGVRVEVHLESLNTAFNAVMPQFGILPSIIEEALEDVYAKHEWSLADRALSNDTRLFPNMAEFYKEAIRVTEQRGYKGEFQGNILAAVKGRIGTLLRGSKGKMFNCRRSINMSLLLERPVILELDSLNDDTKALTILFLMILLREYRQTTTREVNSEGESQRGSGLQHVLLIEEAHRVLENVSQSTNTEVSPDTRARSIRSLVDMLVEMRAYGQGILIAEQSPEKLAPDAIRNTNLKITHMLPGRQDRASMAASMVMDDEQERYLGKLRVGHAAVFLTGMEKASFMTVPAWKDESIHNDHLSDDAVRRLMVDRFIDIEKRTLLPYDGCRYCGEPCLHRAAVEPVTLNKQLAGEFRTALERFDKQPEQEHWSRHWQQLGEVCARAAAAAGRKGSVEAGYCFFAHEIDFPFTQHMRTSFVDGFLASSQ